MSGPAFFDAVCARMRGYPENEREPAGEPFVSWKVQTLLGDLLVTVYRERRVEVFTVYTRFTGNLRAATGALGNQINPHNGKWNIHSFSAEEALAELEGQLDRAGAVQPEQSEPAFALVG